MSIERKSRDNQRPSLALITHEITQKLHGCKVKKLEAVKNCMCLFTSRSCREKGIHIN